MPGLPIFSDMEFSGLFFRAQLMDLTALRAGGALRAPKEQPALGGVETEDS